MKVTSNIVTVLCTLLLSISINGQVTIGDTTAPLSGAILQLKDGTNDSNLLVNASKGLNLPRVELNSRTIPLNETLAQTIEGNDIDTRWGAKEHIGLVVYNISKDKICDPNIVPGIFVWTGEKWEFLGKKVETKKVDKRTITDDTVNKILTISYNGETTSYKYSDFGKAGTWMTENLATKYLPDGTQLTKHANDESRTEPQYYNGAGVADNSPLINTTNKYGLLYNWPGAMAMFLCTTLNQGQIAGIIPGEMEVENMYGTVQGICPAGWHLPSDREYNELEQAITVGADTYSTTTYTDAQKTWNPTWDITTAWRGDIQGSVMKLNGITINGFTSSGSSKSSSDGGFASIMTGYGFLGTAYDVGHVIDFWTSSSYDNVKSWCRALFERSKVPTMFRNGSDRYFLYSVRCKKDNT